MASFDVAIEFPDDDARRRLAGLVGIDDKKRRLEKGLRMILHPASVMAWSNQHHNKVIASLDYVTKRPSLFLLEGDVGVGKTALAESIGDAVARSEKIDIYLYKLSLSSRGSGLVGEMTSLVTSTFESLAKAAAQQKGTGKSRAGYILLIDEADALVQTRASSQMHHEDRAGVNAVIRGIDEISARGLPAAVIMCTNRISSIDPAIQRRAADILTFTRPNEEQRHKILQEALGDVLSADQVKHIVKITGESGDIPGFTFSDLTQRLIPNIVMAAYPNDPVSFGLVKDVLETTKATPEFKDSSHG